MFVLSLLYISNLHVTPQRQQGAKLKFLLLIIISTYIKTPWEFTTLPRIFLKTLLFDEVPYIGYQTDNICYY